MKTRRSAFLLLATGAALVLVIWLAGRRVRMPSPDSAQAPISPQTSAQAMAAGQAQRERGANVPEDGPASNTAPAAAPSAPPAKAKVDLMREGLAALNNERVVFYGMVIDQFGSPVADAEVSGVIQVNNGVRVGTDRVTLTTAGDGTFVVSGYEGKNLGITVKKAGYALATPKTSFAYSLLWPEAERHIPDPSKPVVFKMWKLQGAEPLVAIDQRYKIQSSGTLINFDLLTGRIVPSGGDLRITVQRPNGVVSQRQPQDWGLKIEAVDGGLIETSFAEARVTFQAPEAGYQPSDTLAISTTNHWSDLVQQMFFLSSRNGQVHSKVFLSFNMNANPGEPSSITFRGEANANGSRNWEATAPR